MLRNPGVFCCQVNNMNFILGQKKEMLQIFTEDGRARPVTLIEAGPAVIIQLKTAEKDGYNAVQLGFGSKNPKNIKKPQTGHLKKTRNLNESAKTTDIRWLREFRVDSLDGFKVGDTINVGIFKEGDVVKVSAVSKGKGFQGVVKRHGFHGGPRTHGQKHSEREPGSIGGGGRAGGRVAKGMRMAGRTGGQRVTLHNLEALKIDTDNNAILVSGAVPGSRGTLVEIISQK